MAAGDGSGDEVGGRSVRIVTIVAVLASALVAVAVLHTDLLTGRAPAVAAVPERCDVPVVVADESPTIPGNALDAVFGLLPFVPGVDDSVALDYTEYATAGEYARGSAGLLRAQTRSALAGNGFRAAASVGYRAGPTVGAAEALQFPSPAQAAAFERRTLADACALGVATGFRPLGDVPGAVVFLYHDGTSPPFRAAFLVGDTVLRLNLCICVESQADPFAALESWVRAVDARVRAPLG